MKTNIENNSKQKASVWNLADAKNRLSEVVNLALHQGPQTITRRGEKVLVIDEKSYQKLCGQKISFIDFLLNGPSLDGLDLKRDPAPMREVSL